MFFLAGKRKFSDEEFDDIGFEDDDIEIINADMAYSRAYGHCHGVCKYAREKNTQNGIYAMACHDRVLCSVCVVSSGIS